MAQQHRAGRWLAPTPWARGATWAGSDAGARLLSRPVWEGRSPFQHGPALSAELFVSTSVSAACRPCPHGLCLPPPGGCLSFSPPFGTLEPPSLPLSLCPGGLRLSVLQVLYLSWPGLRVPVSPGACAWVGMRVSLEKSLSASSLQLQAGCHSNRVRGPPLQQLSCGLGEGWGPAGQRAPQGPQSLWRARTPGVAPCLLICGPQTHTSASRCLCRHS